MSSSNLQSASPRTLYRKVWDSHVVRSGGEGAGTHPSILYIDLHAIHEVSSPQAFSVLSERGLRVRRPDRTVGVIDHSVPTAPAGPGGQRPYVSKQARDQVELFIANCRTHGVKCHDWASDDRGIVHVAIPELGLTLPGQTIVCGDSHTSTHGAFGALAFGIGSTEVGHVLATQCLYQQRSKTMKVQVEGQAPSGVGAKDLALAILRAVGFGGGNGYAIEYAGSAIQSLGMEARMTICNMAIEAGARTGMIAPDDVTLNWIKGRRHAPAGPDWDKASEDWLDLVSDPDAIFDKTVKLEASALRPMVTYGVQPCASVTIDEPVPFPESSSDRAALHHMGFEPGKPVEGQPVKTIFIGSCTNGRLPDLREAADILKGRRIAAGVRMLVVPGSNAVKRDAEAAGLDRIFLAAGAEWRESGCSMCIGMNGDVAGRDGLTLSTSNRNFVGRQGPGSRTVLCSPATAAASAVAGRISDASRLEGAG